MSGFKIYHLADLHIRAGCNARARIAEYSFVFTRFVSWLGGQEIGPGDFAVICGDLFHHKSRIESPGIKLFYDLIKSVSGLLPVYIIRGNHDYKQWEDDEIDLISSMLIPDFPNVHYLNATGSTDVSNALNVSGVRLGVLAIQDAIKSGGTNASVKADYVPEFPNIKKGLVNVALFHGPVAKGQLMFQGYDIALLGDIHLQQAFGLGQMLDVGTYASGPIYPLWAKEIQGLTWAYAGSMVRQGPGEPVKGHGFLVWDMGQKVVTAFHIENSVEVANAEEEEAEKEMLKAAVTAVTATVKDKEDEEDKPIKPIKSMYNSPDAWADYLGSNGGTDEMKSFVKSSDLLLLPGDMVDDGSMISCKGAERQVKIKKKLEAYVDSFGASEQQQRPFRLVKAKWDWILCYGGGNVFDFSKLDNQINILSGRNGHGKTSFLEMILLGLYGTGFPSRTNKSRTASIISSVKPASAPCQVILSLLVGKDMVRVTRNFSRAAAGDSKLHSSSKYCLLDMFSEDGSWTSLASGKVAVDKWIGANVGSISSFLLSCMVSQNADADFFSLGPADQKELLDGALNIGTHTRYMELLKESRLAHMAIADLMGATIESLKKSLGAYATNGDGRLLELELALKSVNVAASATSSATFTGRLEPRSHYEEILRTTSVVSANDIQEVAFELEMLKRSRRRAQASIPGGTTCSLAELEEALNLHMLTVAEPEPNVVVAACLYDPSCEKEFERLKALTPLTVNAFGHDAGPYNTECECCLSREKGYKAGLVRGRFLGLWYGKKEYLENCISVLKVSQVRELETRLADLKGTMANRDLASSIVESYDSIVSSRSVLELMLEKQRLADAQEQRFRIMTELDQWTSQKSVLDVRVHLFGDIYRIMDGFVSWLYKESVLPRIAKCTSQVMALVDPDLKLGAAVTDGVFDWTMSSLTEPMFLPMEKASGFQRFLCGLAVRIALGSIGAAGIKPRQLFLDEGFTSCDQTNLSRVPKMLRQLLQLFDAIVLVTHLEELKDAGDVSIRIERDGEGLARIM